MIAIFRHEKVFNITLDFIGNGSNILVSNETSGILRHIWNVRKTPNLIH